MRAARPVLRPDTGAAPVALGQLLWGIARRLPSYIRLGWALGKEPAIPAIHKALLYSAALYSVTPANLVVGAIPVVGQVDSVVLFLLGLRQALDHCPPEIAERHLHRVRLARHQLDRDLGDLARWARRTARETGRLVAGNLRFAGRVARGFGRRTAERIVRSLSEDAPAGSSTARKENRVPQPRSRS